MEQNFPCLRKWAKPTFLFCKNAVVLRVKTKRGSDSCISNGLFSLSFLEQYVPEVLWEFKLQQQITKDWCVFLLHIPLLSQSFLLLLGLEALLRFLELWQKKEPKEQKWEFYKHCLTALFDIVGETHFPLGIWALFANMNMKGRV